MRRQYLKLLVFFATSMFLLALLSPVQAGTVSGMILLQDGSPLVGGVGLFFDSKNGPAPDPTMEFRLAEYVYLLDNEGKFQGELAAGSYYLLGAIRAKPGSGQDENLFFLINGVNDAPLLFKVPVEGLVDLGTLDAVEPHNKHPEL